MKVMLVDSVDLVIWRDGRGSCGDDNGNDDSDVMLVVYIVCYKW